MAQVLTVQSSIAFQPDYAFKVDKSYSPFFIDIVDTERFGFVTEDVSGLTLAELNSIMYNINANSFTYYKNKVLELNPNIDPLELENLINTYENNL